MNIKELRRARFEARQLEKQKFTDQLRKDVDAGYSNAMIAEKHAIAESTVFLIRKKNRF